MGPSTATPKEPELVEQPIVAQLRLVGLADAIGDEEQCYPALTQVAPATSAVSIWEVIRGFLGVDLLLAEKTDAELLAEVARAVDECIVDYAAAEGQARALVAGWRGTLPGL
ncbi:MAG: hypothetical protein OHK0015_21380 [Chloroflexi bacterium OHK40]